MTGGIFGRVKDFIWASGDERHAEQGEVGTVIDAEDEDNSGTPDRKGVGVRVSGSERGLGEAVYGGGETTELTRRRWGSGFDGAPEDNRPNTRNATIPRVGGGKQMARNTLGDNRHAQAPKRELNRKHEQDNDSFMSRHQGLDVRASKGSNVGRHFQTRKDAVGGSLTGDGFHGNEPSLKRQKINDHESRAAPQHAPVDLTAGDSQEGVTEANPWDGDLVGINGKPIRGSKALASQKLEAPPKFESMEHSAADNLTQVGSKKLRHRKRREGGPNSSQASSRGTPVDQHRGGSLEGKDIRYALGKGNANASASEKSSPHQDRKYSTDPETGRPPIDLERDYPPDFENRAGGQQHFRFNGAQRPEETGHRDKTDGVTGSQGLHLRPDGRQRTDAEKYSDAQKKLAEGKRRRRISQSDEERDASPAHETSHYFATREPRAITPPLNSQFVRTTEAPKQLPSALSAQQPKVKARDRMQGASARAPGTGNLANARSASEDELAGGSTMPSNPNVRAQLRKTKQDGTRAGVDSARHHHTGPARKTDTQTKKLESQVEGPALRVPVEYICCRSFFRQRKGIEMVWNKNSKIFNVELNGQLQRVPGSSLAVSIGAADTQKWIASKDSLTVHITGAFNSNSNGNILISFADESGYQEALGYLLDARKDRLAMSSITPEKMNSLVPKMASAILQDFQIKSEKAQNVPTILPQRQYEEDYDDRIVSDGGSDSQPESRSRMVDDQATSRRTNGNASRQQPNLNLRGAFSNLGPRATRQMKPASSPTPAPPSPKRWTKVHHPEPWKTPVVYPPEGVRRVTVDFQDLHRTDEGEFLNDNLISFALRKLEDNMDAEKKAKVHFFSSFFYTALTHSNGRKGFNYDAVKRWTKNKDIFDTPYVVVPLNLDMHWFVAIICNLPEVPRVCAGMEDSSETDETDDNASSSMLDSAAGGNSRDASANAALANGTKNENTEEAMDNLSISDNDDQRSSAVVPETNDFTPAAKATSKKKAPPRPSPSGGKKGYSPDIPAIITLDSVGSTHPVEIKMLKKYLVEEGQAKRGMAIEPAKLQGMTAKGLPEQTNFCDCGVFLLGYMDAFVKDPDGFVARTLTKQLDENVDFADFDANAKRADLRNELLMLNRAQDEARAAKKAAKKASAPASEKASAPAPGAAPAVPSRHSSPAKPKGPEPEVPKNIVQPSVRKTVTPPAHRPEPMWKPQPSASLPAAQDSQESMEAEPPRPLPEPVGRGTKSQSPSTSSRPRHPGTPDPRSRVTKSPSTGHWPRQQVPPVAEEEDKEDQEELVPIDQLSDREMTPQSSTDDSETEIPDSPDDRKVGGAIP